MPDSKTYQSAWAAFKTYSRIRPLGIFLTPRMPSRTLTRSLHIFNNTELCHEGP
jgi:hypothetical protein